MRKHTCCEEDKDGSKLPSLSLFLLNCSSRVQIASVNRYLLMPLLACLTIQRLTDLLLGIITGMFVFVIDIVVFVVGMAKPRTKGGLRRILVGALIPVLFGRVAHGGRLLCSGSCMSRLLLPRIAVGLPAAIPCVRSHADEGLGERDDKMPFVCRLCVRSTVDVETQKIGGRARRRYLSK